jgi:hypothetical protein
MRKPDSFANALQVFPGIGPALGEPGGDDDGRARLPAMAFLQDFEHLVVGNDDADEIRRFGQVGHGPISRHPHDFVVVRVDRVNPYAILRSQYGVEETSPVTALRRCAHHRDRARIEHLVYRTHLGVSPHRHAGFSVRASRGRAG